MSNRFFTSAGIISMLLLSACGGQETASSYSGPSNRADSSEQLLAAQGSWDLIESDDALDPIAMHSSAKKRVNPANSDPKQYVPESKVASAAGLNEGGDVNFRLIRMQRDMKGLNAPVLEMPGSTDDMVLAHNEAILAAKLQDFAPASGVSVQQPPIPASKPQAAPPVPAQYALKAPDVMNDANKVSTPAVSGLVQSIRFGEHPDKTRMVLDLNENASFKTSVEKGGMIVLVELPQSAWSALSQDTLNHPFISSYSVKKSSAGGSVLALQMKKPVKVLDSAALPPNTQYNHHRIYLDIAAS